MQSPCLQLCENYHLGFRLRPNQAQNLISSIATAPSFLKPEISDKRFIIRCQKRPNNGQRKVNSKEKVTLRGKKENVWSVDDGVSKLEKEKGRAKQGRKKGRRVIRGKRSRDGRVLVSGAMLMEVETVLQTQEPVIRPVWNTFASSVSGIWKGVGAVFSPSTAEIDPIDIGNKNENLYDCYTLSRIEALPSSGGTSQIHRKINWVALNPHGEVSHHTGGSKNEGGLQNKTVSLPAFESFDLGRSDVMDEDDMGNEPGLVFFEDGSYSRGPANIPLGEADESSYYLSPTFKFEQCLVKGCHKRLRIVHTIEFGDGGADVQIMRVAVYEEQWVSPANIQDLSDVDFELKPFSQRKRTRPSELTGSWKVFEISATPVYSEEEASYNEASSGSSTVYFCMETLKKRIMPDSSVHFGEEEMLDMQDATILWLPGGVTAYVDINKDGILTIGVGWYSDEGINQAMERDYDTDGKLKEVRWKSEVKRRWPDPLPFSV